MNLQHAIDNYLGQPLALGSEKAASKDRLLRDLEKAQQASDRAFWVSMIAAAVLFAATIFVPLIATPAGNVKVVVQGVLGITTAGVVTLMFRQWRVKAHTGLLVTFAAHGDEASLRQFLYVTRSVLLGSAPQNSMDRS